MLRGLLNPRRVGGLTEGWGELSPEPHKAAGMLPVSNWALQTWPCCGVRGALGCYRA